MASLAFGPSAFTAFAPKPELFSITIITSVYIINKRAQRPTFAKIQFFSVKINNFYLNSHFFVYSDLFVPPIVLPNPTLLFEA